MPTNIISRRAALAELQKRLVQKNQVIFDRSPEKLTRTEWDFFLSRCHPKQREFLLDRSKRKALLCPRRTGKTTTLLFKALITAKQYPGCDIAYIVPSSKEHAQRLFWRPLRKLNAALTLGLEFKVADNVVETPNNSHIYVFGAKNRDSESKLRGNAWAAVFLDECKDFGTNFEALIIEAVLPGLEDYDGTLILAGTPGNVLDGVFYNVTVKKPEGWSIHKWIKSDNSFLPDDARDLKAIERREYFPFGLDASSPKFRREQLAEWCTDETERVYSYNDERNGWEGSTFRDLPAGHNWMYVLGLDLGERDENAFIVGAFSLTCMELYIVHEYHRSRMSIDEIANHTKYLQNELGDFTAMVADTGGYGRGIVTDMATRHGLHFEAADKRGNKLGNIAQMNSDLLCGRIRANPNSDLAREWKKLVRKFRVSDKKVILGHSDLGDAALYMWRASKHYAAHRESAKPKRNTPEWWMQVEQEAMDNAIRQRQGVCEGRLPAISDTAEAVH